MLYDGTRFGRWIKEQRKAMDFTQRELAEQIGCSEFTLRKFEAGTRRPSRQIVERLTQFFGLSPHQAQEVMKWARLGDRQEKSNHELRITNYDSDNPQSTTSPNNLPSRLTRLIGRTPELSEASNYLLREDARLLTLLGPPGVGKTRLSIEVALDMRAHCSDGVFFVDLALVRDADMVFAAIAQTLGYKQSGSQDVLSHLAQVLKSKRMLLVLDNFEQVTQVAPEVVRLLESCPDLKVIVTSREALRVRGEQQLAVPTLPLPNPANPISPEELMGYASIALFLERGRSVNPSFRLTEENAAEVAAICTSLDGLPLAIELAAAHINVLSPAAMLARLDNRLTLLTDGARDLPSRHQTLRMAIDWSYDLLSQQEQTLFTQMSVFAGGCNLVALEAVCSPFGVDHVETLVEKSLLQQREGVGGEVRFYMLQTIHDHAMERLEEIEPVRGSDVEELRARHANYYLSVAQEAEQHLNSEDQEAWLDHLEEDHDNLRGALAWAISSAEYDLAAHIAGTLLRFWEVRGYWSEGRRWLDAVLAHRAALSARARAMATIAAGRLSYLQDDNDRAQSYFEESLKLHREVGDQPGVAQALGGLAYLAAKRGEREAARSFLEESLAVSRALGDRPKIARILTNLGRLAMEAGDYERAEALERDSLALFRDLHDKSGMAAVLANLGQLAAENEDYDTAIALLEESLVLNRELGDKGHIAWVLGDLGIATLAAGKYERSMAVYGEASKLFLELGDKSGWATSLFMRGVTLAYQGEYRSAASSFGQSFQVCLEIGDEAGCAWGIDGLAFVATTESQPVHAALLAGMAEALRDKTGYRIELIEHPLHERTLATLHSVMTDADLDQALSEGRDTNFEQIITYVSRNTGA
ncbi:MAG TPA: tetratricopeptide repeat protein [Chloroflexia bacterium]|nr:tetratricopeptide repeat protein [Chloroflexia bacterium]